MRLKQRHERAVLGIDALDDADLAIEYAGVVVVYELDDAIARTHGCAVAPTWPTGRVITCGSGAALTTSHKTPISTFITVLSDCARGKESIKHNRFSQ